VKSTYPKLSNAIFVAFHSFTKAHLIVFSTPCHTNQNNDLISTTNKNDTT
jgi:hypothetical protein